MQTYLLITDSWFHDCYRWLEIVQNCIPTSETYNQQLHTKHSLFCLIIINTLQYYRRRASNGAISLERTVSETYHHSLNCMLTIYNAYSLHKDKTTKRKVTYSISFFSANLQIVFVEEHFIFSCLIWDGNISLPLVSKNCINITDNGFYFCGVIAHWPMLIIQNCLQRERHSVRLKITGIVSIENSKVLKALNFRAKVR